MDAQPEFCGQPHHPTLSPKSRNNCMFGLMTPRGVRKAGWRAFELLHRHAGTHRLNVTLGDQTTGSSNGDDIYAMATINGTDTGASDSLRVFLSWWANPMYNGTENTSSSTNSVVAAAATALAPPCPGFVTLPGDCGGHNIQEVSGNVTVTNCTEPISSLYITQGWPSRLIHSHYHCVVCVHIV